MKATIYHNPKCSTSRQVLEMLREAGADVTVIDYLKTPPSKAELRRLYAEAGLTPNQGLRMREDAPKALADAPADTVLDAMAAQPILIERPLVETEKGVRLARPKERVYEIL
ncbi:arsenate reductase (glutaredoxin) [Allosphingosinicella sp.]|uniref:arsenate reductase (glutaredoxin) n=1 Tax=Allosphingosinicella sp. TaxID=2823234 RepID=UPI0037840B81